ncbi:hypothetical protein Tco_1537551, partial [Tanacetum coccineum]
MFIKYSTEAKSEPEPEPELVKRKTSSKRRVKKKVTLSVDDNIISSDLDTTLELGKSISKTEAEEAEAARQVNATHARIETESVPESTKRRKSGKVTSDPPKKLKGTRGSSEGTGTIPRVPDESTVVSATSSEGIESEYSEEDKLDDEEKDDKEGNADDEDDETKSDEDDIYKYKIRVRKDEDEEMLNAEDEDSDKEVTDAVKADAEKTSEVKDDAKKTELPLTSSSLSVSSGLEISFLNFLLIRLYSHSSIKSPSIATVTTLPPPFVSTTPSVPQKTKTLIPTPTIITDAPIITTADYEFDTLSVVQLRVAKLEKDVSKFKKIDLSPEALAALKTQVPSVVDNYLGSKVRDVFQKELKNTQQILFRNILCTK